MRAFLSEVNNTFADLLILDRWLKTPMRARIALSRSLVIGGEKTNNKIKKQMQKFDIFTDSLFCMSTKIAYFNSFHQCNKSTMIVMSLLL